MAKNCKMGGLVVPENVAKNADAFAVWATKVAKRIANHPRKGSSIGFGYRTFDVGSRVVICKHEDAFDKVVGALNELRGDLQAGRPAMAQ